MSVTTLFTTDAARHWQPLRVFNMFRLVVAAMFLLFVATRTPQFLGSYNPQLFALINVIYLMSTAIWLLASYRRWLPLEIQAYAQVGTDIVVITMLMHLSGGVTSGLGMLMLATIAGASLLLPDRRAIFFAAVASLALLSEQIYADLSNSFITTSYAQTGLLGAALLTTALLAITLARRARLSEALAAKRGFDLANLAELNEHVIGSIRSGIVVIDDKAGIIVMNDAAWSLLGQPGTPHSQTLSHLSYPLASLYEDWGRGELKNESHDIKASGGTDLQVRFTGIGDKKNHATLISIDDTAEMRRQMQQMKLASLGRLTASIAHEVRNPLGAISHAAQLLGESPDLQTPDRRLVRMIQEQSSRMNTIIHNVLRLSRKEQPTPEEINLGEWLRTFIGEFMRNQQLEDSWATVSITPPDTAVYMDTNHLYQVLWNLCVNASKYGAKAGQAGAVYLQGGLTPDSRTPYLDVIDNGPGIDPKLQAQLFEPFFTTSTSGTGLGLYISRELCENNGGSLEYISGPAGGSCFRIQFPRQKAEDNTVAKRAYR